MRTLAVVLGALSLAPMLVAAETSPSRQNRTTRPTMENLFEFQLKRTSSDAVFSPRGPQEGEHVGSGEGTVSGRLKGIIRWSLYENSYTQACAMQFVGEIRTEDGVRIPFEGQGFAIVPDRDRPSLWATGGAFRFEPGDARYAWLGSKLTPWVGDFNMDTVEARLSFYSDSVESPSSRRTGS